MRQFLPGQEIYTPLTRQDITEGACHLAGKTYGATLKYLSTY